MKAILISGFEREEKHKDKQTSDFIDDCKRFAKYLILKVGLKNTDISFFKPTKIKLINLWGLFESVRNTINSYPNEPLVIYYSGHGEKTYWNLRATKKSGERNYFFKFKRLLGLLKKRKAPLIVVANCCYGMVLKKELKKLNYPWLLIGLAPESRVGYGSMQAQLELLWSHRQIFFPLYEDSAGKLVKSIKIKSYNKKFYGFKYGDGKHFRKFFFNFNYKRIKIVLRAGSDLDHLMFPKK
ncbi:MAG: hypothetical protein ACYC3G_00925 [Minisyncoccota bacterium]